MRDALTLKGRPVVSERPIEQWHGGGGEKPAWLLKGWGRETHMQESNPKCTFKVKYGRF